MKGETMQNIQHDYTGFDMINEGSEAMIVHADGVFEFVFISQSEITFAYIRDALRYPVMDDQKVVYPIPVKVWHVPGVHRWQGRKVRTYMDISLQGLGFVPINDFATEMYTYFHPDQKEIIPLRGALVIVWTEE
jgi:hypothetical protein